MNNELIGKILEYSIKIGASDIHITEGKTIKFRVDGIINSLDKSGVIENQEIKKILSELLNGNEEMLKKFSEKNDIDFSYIHSNGNSFRVNAFYTLGKIAFVLKRISSNTIDMKTLMMPPATSLFTQLKQGLVLITGPTGSGKSTSMISIIEKINQERSEHILTIEDPIEFLFTDKKSTFSQREIGRDAKSFSSALKSALREDPNVIIIGELRDPETVKSALELAETGHLVISTLHSGSAVQSINRLISFFPLNTQFLVREKLSFTLKGVISQKLIPKIGGGRVGIFELLIVDNGVKNLIRSGKIEMIQSIIETSSKEGMITMEKYAEKLKEHGIVDEKDYINFFKED